MRSGWGGRFRGGRQVLGILWRADRARTLGAGVLGISAAVLTPLNTLLLGALIDAVVRERTEAALTVGLLIGALATVSSVARVLSFRLAMHIREVGGHALRQHIGRTVARIPGIGHLERPDVADKVELLRGTQTMLAGLATAVIHNLAQVASAAVTLTILARVSPWFALLIVFGAPTVWVGARNARAANRLQEELTPDLRRMRHLAETLQTTEPAGEVRVFGLAPELSKRHHALWRHADRLRTRQQLRSQALRSASWLFFALGYLGALGMVLQSAIEGRATAGEVAIVATLGAQVRGVLANLVGMATWLVEILKASERFAWMEDMAATDTQLLAGATGHAPLRLEHGIDLVDVSFRYPGTEVDVLTDVTIHLPAGSTVAVVGDNGAGKSTLVKLLARFYEPTTGEILVDGQPLRDIPVEEWRTRLSAGFQDFARLHFRALEAVGVGSHQVLASDEPEPEVLAAMARASSSPVLEDLPQGLQTQLGTAFNDGVDLSGGQWQKIALGRSMMRTEPLLVLLDEPTAALDARAEHELFRRYADSKESTVGGITVLVSHRFSTVRVADLILVVDGCTVATSGTHDQLMAEQGLYAELYELQARSYR